MTSPPLAIAASNLVLTLGEGGGAVDILRGIDLAVPQGQTLALLGPSGSGKSSLMALLSGLERATSGSLRIAGADFAALTEDALAAARRGRIGIVLQAFHLLPTMTALENVMTPMELAGMTDARSRAEAELESVGLGHRLRSRPSQLSGGQQQRVAIARALVAEPKLVLADEPTGNLDTRASDEIVALLRQVANEWGRAVIMVTHDAHIASYADRILFLRDGVIVDALRLEAYDRANADLVADRLRQLA